MFFLEFSRPRVSAAPPTCYPPRAAGALRRARSKGAIMPWYAYVAYFFPGAFLVNAVPHFVSGVCRRRFPTAFASPPAKGDSSPIVEVLWGAINLVIASPLVYRVRDVHRLHST